MGEDNCGIKISRLVEGLGLTIKSCETVQLFSPAWKCNLIRSAQCKMSCNSQIDCFLFQSCNLSWSLAMCLVSFGGLKRDRDLSPTVNIGIDYWQVHNNGHDWASTERESSTNHFDGLAFSCAYSLPLHVLECEHVASMHLLCKFLGHTHLSFAVSARMSFFEAIQTLRFVLHRSLAY